MHEGNCRERIVADATALAHERRVAQTLDRHIREMDVGSLAIDVLAVLCLPTARLLEHAVRAA